MNMFDKEMATAQAMLRRGGGFVQALGNALMRADDINRAKIRSAFPEYYDEYYKIAEANNWYEEEL